MTVSWLGINPDGLYRVIPEEIILRGLVAVCYHYEAREGKFDWAMNRMSDALERWVTLGLPYRQENGRRLFDSCELANFILWANIHRGDPVFTEVLVPMCRRKVAELCPTGLPRIGASHASDFLLEVQREFNLQGITTERVLRLRVPVPLEGHRCGPAQVRLIEPAPCTALVLQTPGRLELQFKNKPLPERLTVEVHSRLRAWAESYDVEPERLEKWDENSPEYELYTRPNEGLIRVTPFLVELAATLTANSSNAWQSVCAFWGFLFEHLKPGYIHHEELDDSDPLGDLIRRGWFDCYAGSCLMAALCRARGIPARVLGGQPLYLARSAFHYWMEVLLPPYGWVPFDLYSWILGYGEDNQSHWKNYYLGRLDSRATTACLPRLTLGSPGVRFPEKWFMYTDYCPDGTLIAIHGLENCRELYHDVVRVRRLD